MWIFGLEIRKFWNDKLEAGIRYLDTLTIITTTIITVLKLLNAYKYNRIVIM